MDRENTVIKNLSRLFNAEVEIEEGKYIFKKKRTAKIFKETSEINEMLELDIYVECYQEQDRLFNKAEVFLLPDEYKDFTGTLIQHEILLPTSYRQWRINDSALVCLCMESQEVPEQFIERLLGTLEAMDE